eukprot:TRINITY_DN5852_c0_g2_i1.p1 TRINITY_DN5852_c0_g2~~TRINITY_DN5852_c0_g2_i1.p1  ORF type:complete len:590 (+),score=246.90 TRINITY_DN5852_c0_g2_i1:112-1881(+)
MSAEKLFKKAPLHKYASTSDLPSDHPPTAMPALKYKSTTDIRSKEVQRLYFELPFTATMGMPRESVYRRRSRMSILLPSAPKLELPEESVLIEEVEPEELEHEIATGKLTPSLAVASLLAMQSTLQFGFNSGVINGCEAVVFPGHTPLEWSVVVSIFCVGGLMGAFAGGHLSNALGRRGALMLASYVFLASGVIMFFARSIAWLIFARLLVGTAAGASTVFVPIYVGEIAPPMLRGILGALSQFHLVFGILVANVMSLSLATEDSWRYLFAFTCVPAIIQLALSPWLLESPRLLLMRGQRAEAAAALTQLRAVDDVDDEINAIIDASRFEAPSRAGGVLSNLDNPRILYGLLVGCGLHLAQQLSGINAVFYYSTSFFDAIGLEDPRMGTILVGAVNVLATVAAIYLMDAFGHKSLLLWSVGGMLVSSVVVTLALVFGAAAPAAWNAVSVVAIMAFVSFFEIGLGPVAWLLTGLLFQAKLRSSASAVATVLNWISNFMVGMFYPMLATALGAYSWLPFTGVLAVTFAGVAWGLIETRDKTIEEIQDDIGARVDRSSAAAAVSSHLGGVGGGESKGLKKAFQAGYGAALKA